MDDIEAQQHDSSNLQGEKLLGRGHQWVIQRRRSAGAKRKPTHLSVVWCSVPHSCPIECEKETAPQAPSLQDLEGMLMVR